jgi:hypothetical protein
MSQIAAARREDEICKDALGLSRDEFHALVGVMSHERAFGHGPLRKELEKFLSRRPSTHSLVRAGWLIADGKPIRLASTRRAWRALGLTP